MSSFGLSFTACSFSIKKLHTHKAKSYDLNNSIPCKMNDNCFERTVFELFSEFVRENADVSVDTANKRMFSCEQEDEWAGSEEHFNYKYLLIHSGEYGSSSELIDTVTGITTYQRSENEAEIRPFYLFIVVPKNEMTEHVVQKGMLFFQNVGPYGVKTETTGRLINFFSDRGLSFTCQTISSGLFFSKVVHHNTLKSIQCVKHKRPEDIADRQGFGYGREVKVIDKLSIALSVWDHLKQCFVSFSNDRNQLFEYPGIGAGYDEVKLVVEIGSKKRTISLHNMENLSIIEEIPEEIKDATGHPVLERLVPHFVNSATEYLSQMVLHF